MKFLLKPLEEWVLVISYPLRNPLWPKEKDNVPLKWNHHQPKTHTLPRNKVKALNQMNKIKGKIKGNLMLPPDIRGNPEAVFDVIQLPSGEILSVKLKKSSGHAAYDSAIERAILKSSPLPKPEQGDLFSRALELKFRPLEE